MSIEKQTITTPPHVGDDADHSRPVVGIAHDTGTVHRYPNHRHFRAQFLYAIRGLMTVTADAGTWVVPPQQAVWIPAGIAHAVSSTEALSMRTLYLHPELCARLPTTCRVVHVSLFLRELVLKLVSACADRQAGGDVDRLAAVLVDELCELRPNPFHLPMPDDPRLAWIAEALLSAPHDGRRLEDFAQHAGASARTLSRLFVRDTGMSFGRWRRQLRLLRAIAWLSRGQSVSGVAYDLGYHSPSAFIAMFRRALGEPPGRFLRGGEAVGASYESR